MAIYVSVQYDGGFLPGMNDTVDSMLLPSRSPIKCHEKVMCLQPPRSKRFDISPPLSGGCSEGLDICGKIFH